MLGMPDIRWYTTIPGGLSGDADVGRLVVVDGLVWEFEVVGESTRVYMYTWDDVKDNERFRSYG